MLSNLLLSERPTGMIFSSPILFLCWIGNERKVAEDRATFKAPRIAAPIAA